MKLLLTILPLFVLLSCTHSSHHYGSPQGVPVMTAASVGTNSTLVLAANINRGYLIIQNQSSTAMCQVSFGAAIVSTEGLYIQPGQNYEPVEAFAKSSVYMKCASSATPIELMETNY